MKLDTSSYYPKSPLDDEPEETEIRIAVIEPESCDANEAEHEPLHEESDMEREPDPGFLTGVSNILSWVLVPMFMPVYGIMLSFGLTILAYTGFGVRIAFTAIAAAFNVVVPAIVIILLKRFGMIEDIGLNNRKERLIPFIVSTLAMAGTGLFMHFKGAPEWLMMFFFGGAAAGLIEAVVNRWWKISVHAAGIAGIVALLIHIMLSQYHAPATLNWLLIAVGCAGLLGSARIWLGRHTLMQVLAGYAVGFCSVYFLMQI